MNLYTLNDWLILGLVLLLGLLIGMTMLAGGKWKRRHREEVRRREEAVSQRDERIAELEAENERLRKDAREMDSLRHAAAKTPPRNPDDERGHA